MRHSLALCMCIMMSRGLQYVNCVCFLGWSASADTLWQSLSESPFLNVLSMVAVHRGLTIYDHALLVCGAVGGGQYAYTIVGVEWNASTAEAAFLIADPHYAGPDNVDKASTCDRIGRNALCRAVPTLRHETCCLLCCRLRFSSA